MTKTIDAIYEDGVLKPLGKVDLAEGARVTISIRGAELERFYRAIPIKVSKEDLEDAESALYEP